MQASFQQEQSDFTAEGHLYILWLGDENRGYHLNAAVTNRLFIPELLGEEEGYKRNFVGALPGSIPPGVESFYVRGDHGVTLPQLWSAIEESEV